MVKLVLYVVALAALVIIAVWFAETPGTVAVEWHGWRIDTSVAMLFVIVAGALAVGTFLVRGWSTLVGAGRAFQSARKDKKLNRGLDALAKGFAAVHGGEPTTAAKASRDARSALGDVAAVRFLDQQLLMLNGNNSDASAAARILLDEAGLESAALRDLATVALESGDRENALGHALKALAQKPSPKWAAKLVLDLQVALAKWEDAAATVQKKEVQQTLNGMDINVLTAALFARAASAALKKQDSGTAIKWARKAISADPASTQASACLGLALIADGKAKKAAAELERAWALSPSPVLLSAYLQIAPGESTLARAGRVEKLVSGNPDHAESRLALAEAALAAELWGQARSRLEPLLDQGTAPDIRAQAAALMAQVDLGDTDDAEAASKALSMALDARALRDQQPEPASVAELLSVQN